MSSPSSSLDPFKAPLLPTFSNLASPSIAGIKPFPPSPSPASHARRPSSSRFPPRRALSIPLVLISFLALAVYLSRSHAASTTPSSAYAARLSEGWIPWANSRSPSLPSSLQRARVLPPSLCSGGAASTEELDERFERARKPLPVAAGLEERLRAWEDDAPGWGVESADWVRKNLEFCPPHRIRPNQNSDLLNNAHLVWSSMNSSRVMQLRGEMAAYLRKREREGAMGEKAWGEGKSNELAQGLVFTAGNADTFSRVLLTLKMLRNHLHTSLPAEIFSFPGEEPDAETRAALEEYGATLRVVEDAMRDESRTCATAIIRSRFREVLFLDSDNIPAASLMPLDSPVPKPVLDAARERNTSDLWSVRREDGTEEEAWGKPSGLWESKAYQRLGAIWRTQADNSIWAIIGVPCRDEWEQEAGQILVDKRRNLDALLLAEWMMDSSRFKFWFNFSDGDKDLFRFAFLALRKRWGVPGRYVSVGALPRNTLSGFCGHTMLQHDHLGKPLFVHANLLKQIPSGIGRGFAWGRHRQLRTQPSSLSLSGTGASAFASSHALEAADPLVDEDTDCDALADVGNDGGFHGGWTSALCIDTRWEDPRSSAELSSAAYSAALSLPNPSSFPLEDLAATVDLSYTAAPDGFEVRFAAGEALEVVQWAEEPRLRGFEEAFFAEGGRLNGKGF
ncbi:hypothetical protein JCM10450v2_007604 [Rhodotorula kratochvilovae]